MMRSDYTNCQKKTFSDYSIKSNHELEIIIENQHKFRPEIIPVIRDILTERGRQADTYVEIVSQTESFTNETENDVIADMAFKETFFSPKGRIGRDRYFLRTVLLNIPFGILYFGAIYVDLSLSSNLILLLQLGTLVCLIFRLIQTFKRFHDINASGWHSLWTLIPGVNVVLWLVLILVKGTPGENKYGYPPSETKHFKS